MNLARLIVVPLLCTSLAVCASLAWAESGPAKAVQSERTRPGTPPSVLQMRQPSTPAANLPTQIRTQFPASLVQPPPDALISHRIGQNLPQVAPQVSNTPAHKTPPTRPTPGRVTPRARVMQGGDTFGTATVILSVPYSDSGNTCGYNDDYTPPCGFAGGPDVVYVYSPRADGCINVSLCGSSYDTELAIAQDDPSQIFACNDDFCGLQSELDFVNVLAGHNYYIIVDGYGTSCGNYTLNVTPCPAQPSPIQCPPGATAEGEPDCGPDYVDNYDGGCNSNPPVFIDIPCSTDTTRICGTYGTYLFQGSPYRDTDWYRLNINDVTTVHFCTTGQYETSIFIVDGNGGCGGGVIAYAASTGPGQPACIDASLGGGTYYLVVATTNFTGVPCGSNYYMTVIEDSCPPPPAPPQCAANAIPEGEPVCTDGYNDNYDAGCNSFPPTFFDLACAPGTVEVCGSYGDYLNAGQQYRDTDWYRIVINQTAPITMSVKGQYPTSIYILDGRAGCGGLGFICGQQGGANQTLTCTATLSPGTYYLFVATSTFSGYPCGGIYVMDVTRDACPPPFRITCPVGAGDEGEPVCQDGYLDNYDAGCNSDPPTFISPYRGSLGNLDCQQGTAYLCGTYGTYLYQGLEYRDTDWYQVVLQGNSHIKYQAVGEAPTTIFLLNGSAGCGGLSFICGSDGQPGDTLTCEADLTAGTYWLFIATTDFAGVPCGSKYLISVTQSACPQPIRVECPQVGIAEGEPICSDIYIDNYNGGCNSNPPVFTPLPCSDDSTVICGTYGTYRFNGYDYRDTDWYQFALTVPSHVKFCATGEGPTQIDVLNGSAGCPGIVFECAASGVAGERICCEADLQPGIHWFFVSTSTFTGVACGSRYTAVVTGLGCSGSTPIQVNVGAVAAEASAGAVQVRWSAYLDTPAQFRVMRGLSANGGFDQVGEVITYSGQHDLSFSDRSVTPATEYFYRVEYRLTGDWMAAGTAHVLTPSGRLAIHSVSPNPTSGDSRINYELPRAASVRLEIFDVSGHRVRVLIGDHVVPAGYASASWDGRNDRGGTLPAGAYFIRLAMADKVVTHRVVLMR